MSVLAKYRIVGYITTLIVHLTNLYVMDKGLKTTKDTRMKQIEAVLVVLFTMWNLLFQIAYAIFGLVCDLSYKKGDNKLSKYRELMFESIIWPSSVFIVIFFWPIFFVDRELLYQKFIDDTFPILSNFLMHFFILVVTLWETRHLIKKERVSHTRNLIISSILYMTYIFCALIFYAITGLWPYPGTYKIYGTVYFYITIMFMYVLMLMCYATQWHFEKLFWPKIKKSV